MEEEFLKELNKYITSNSTFKINKMLLSLTEKIDNREILLSAINTKNIFIVAAVVDRVNDLILDKETINTAIKSKSELVVRYCCDKSKVSVDKETLSLAIETGNNLILKHVLKIKSVDGVDRDILKKALNSNNKYIMREVLDAITDPQIIKEYETSIRKALFTQNDIKNYIGQLLSDSGNTNNDYEYQALTFDIYKDIIKQNYLNDFVPKNFDINSFEKSLDESKLYHNLHNNIDFSSLNDHNRFLILPLSSEKHNFSCLISREKDNKNLSVTLVNLGSLPSENSNSSYVEYIIEESYLKSLLQKYAQNPRKSFRRESVEFVYNDFAQNSQAVYPLNISSRRQKVGNCFIKNIEKAIRLALSKSLTRTIDSEFNDEDLRFNGINEKPYRIKFMKPLQKGIHKSNYINTIDFKRQLIQLVVKMFPEWKSSINEQWNKYFIRKSDTIIDEKIANDKRGIDKTFKKILN